MNFRPSQLIGTTGSDGLEILGPQIMKPPARPPDRGRYEHPNDPECAVGWKCRVATSEEWLEGERRLKARKLEGAQNAAIDSLDWTHAKITEIEQRIAALDFQIMHDRNPIGRGQRKAQTDVEIAQAKRELVEWRSRHADTVDKAKALGVEVSP